MTTAIDPRSLRRGRDRRGKRVPEEALIGLLIPDGPPLAMYDVGVGCFSEFLTLRKLWPEMAVCGCEPCPAEHADLLPIFPGTLLPVAVGAENGRRTFRATKAGVGGSSFHRKASSVYADVEVDVWTLDRFDEHFGKPDKILLWMDVEDSELEALRGAANLLASDRLRWINLETRDANEPGLPTTGEINAFLRPFGFVPVHRYNVQGAYPEAPGDVVYFREGTLPLIACNGGVQK